MKARDFLNREELRRIGRHYLAHSDRTPEEEASWESYIRTVFTSVAAIVWTALILLTLITWPPEYVIFRDDPQMRFFISAWRLAFLVPSIIGFLALAAFKELRRRPFLVIGAAGCLSGAVWGYSAGVLGGG